MAKKVIVWGTGNVGRPAIRAVLTHSDLELHAVIVSSESKAGRDAGELAGVAHCGVTATRDWQSIISTGADAVVYSATADTRPEEAIAEVIACLSAGINVVAPGLYFYLDPESTPAEALAPIESACSSSGASLFTSGIDPGWVMDMLPVVLSAATADIREIRTREIFNYALYDQPRVVREVIGFGQSMEELPMMLHDFAIDLVWSPMLRLVARALGKPVEKIDIAVQRRPLEASVEVPGMGLFEEGTQGAFRFEVTGYHGGQPLYVLEHITRIDDSCAPDWPYPPEGQGCHQVLISGSPRLEVTVHGHDPVEPGVAGGGNASAAAWLVNAIPAVCAAKPGVVTVLDLPGLTGAAQLQVA
ncbi:dihydrodipicolinate reductase [Seongchinamella unica]|uniref:Dihydrodipicolinate reductase n=1 Tax=Seongchinamella unica TaxID=2547392 RepID=A0A4R5LN73_9GAMM|nr:dihydrodipicolinate reductase [Seongchinamella unica]TDG11638.1 dihydrodipicolinate reductase [Seongchinamella unica]